MRREEGNAVDGPFSATCYIIPMPFSTDSMTAAAMTEPI
jgi:hypothetical protein